MDCTLLARHLPNSLLTPHTAFFVRARDFFEFIWRPLCERRIQTRYAAAKALSACLRMLQGRTYYLQWYVAVLPFSSSLYARPSLVPLPTYANPVRNLHPACPLTQVLRDVRSHDKSVE